MCDLNAATTADILKVILTDPGFDFEGAVRAIYENEGFKAADTPELSEQLRDLLLENDERKADEADEILGCTAISIKGGTRQKTDVDHFLTTRRPRNRRSGRRTASAPSSRLGPGRRSRRSGASTRRRLK